MLQGTDPRKVFDKTLLELGKENDRIVAISCDTRDSGFASFFEAFPARSIEAGISEQNAVGVAAGLAKKGFIPVVATICPFITMRVYEQIRDDVGYVHMKVVLVGIGGGLAYATLGSTHEANEDIAIMKTIPNLNVTAPGDATEVEVALRMAVAADEGTFLRLPKFPHRLPAEPEKRSIKPGKAELLREGADIMFLTYGPMVEQALKAAELLQQKGINTGVMDFMTVKPFDEAALAGIARRVKCLISVEEHSVVGGLGHSAAAALAPLRDAAPLYITGIPEGGKVTGPYEQVLDVYGLTAEKIAENAQSIYTGL